MDTKDARTEVMNTKNKFVDLVIRTERADTRKQDL